MREGACATVYQHKGSVIDKSLASFLWKWQHFAFVAGRRVVDPKRWSTPCSGRVDSPFVKPVRGDDLLGQESSQGGAMVRGPKKQ